MDGVSGTTSAAANEKLDDAEVRKNIIVLAATNRPWDLDDALIRRLEKRIYIPLPTEVGRLSLFKINLRGVKVEESIDWDSLVSKCDGYSGADISNVCRDAAMMPMRRKLISGNFGFNLDEIQRLEKEVEVPLSLSDF
jgi:katanin p60 ATPase-containing subunit A1